MTIEFFITMDITTLNRSLHRIFPHLYNFSFLLREIRLAEEFNEIHKNVVHDYDPVTNTFQIGTVKIRKRSDVFDFIFQEDQAYDILCQSLRYNLKCEYINVNGKTISFRTALGLACLPTINPLIDMVEDGELT